MLLSFIAVRRFRVPDPDAESLVQDVLAAYLGSKHPILDARSWFVGAISNSCRHYWRQPARMVPQTPEVESLASPESEDIEDRLATCMSIRQALGFLDPRCQDVLRLRFTDGYKLRELAVQLGITSTNAARVMYTCLERLRSVYTRLMGASP